MTSNWVPDALVGTEGKGWDQVTAELAFEAQWPERLLSSIALLHTLIDAIGPMPDALQAKEMGRLTAKLIGLRTMSLAVTAQLAVGQNPALAASCVKDLGSHLRAGDPRTWHNCWWTLHRPPTAVASMRACSRS